jgi:phosphoserine phosphatase RsbU/P
MSTKQLKIVVADDSASIQSSIVQMLEGDTEVNKNILIAQNGREACILTFDEKPDLVLIDIEMPVMSGVDAIKKIRSNQLIKNTPIIVMSSTRQFEDAFNAGADDFLLKPFNRYELLMRIKLNLQLAEKRQELKKKHELLKTQKQEAVTQRDVILLQKTELMDGLHYARFVQEATLPSAEILNNLFDSYFVFNRPKHIVSGDFYWVNHKKEFTYIALGDCTGHGMSGALMSMAGTAFLNEIILKDPYIKADQVLNKLRNRVIKLLNQKGDIGEASNGMDIALCIINEETGTMQYAGANNPIFLAKKNEPFEIIKGDRMPIGYFFDHDKPFTLRERNIKKGDCLYLFSDGYSDQFGGPLGQKLRYNRFRDLILQANILATMDKQFQLISNTMDEWIEGFDQVDDMLVLGIRL